MNVEKIINEIEGKMLELKRATKFTGLSFECHTNGGRCYGFLYGNEKCIYCIDKKELINVLKRKEILFRKF